GLAERLHPADLPAVLAVPGVAWWSSLLGVLVLVAVGLVMTAVMQSSTAAIAVTLSAYFTGAIGLDQGCALIIGQNIGTATSSAMAAIGASSTAKRLALAYVLFKVIAAVIALLLFPVFTPILISASRTIDGVTLLAGYHTAYNVVGVLVLLPLMDQFTRFVERILPERNIGLTRCLDPAALATPIAAVEAVRRTVARALIAVCRSLDNALQAASRGEAVWSGKDAVSVPAAADALRQAQIFMSDVSGPPESDDEQRRLTNTLHALEHASRLAEAAGDKAEFTALNGGPDDVRASRLCADAMRNAVVAASEVAARNVGGDHVTPIEARSVGRELPGAETFDLSSASTGKPLCGWRAAGKHWPSCSAGIAVRRSAQSRVERSRAARRSLASMRSGASAHVRITLGAPQRTSSVAHNAAADQSAWAHEKGVCLWTECAEFLKSAGVFSLWKLGASV